MPLYLALFLVSLGVHRLWNYEAVFERPRRLAARLNCKPISCASCNPVWIAATVALAAWRLGLIPVWEACAFPLACYPGIRAAVWLYAQSDILTLIRAGNPGAAAVQAIPVAPTPPMALIAGVRPASPAEECKTCEDKRAAFAAERARTDAYAKRIVIFAPLTQMELATRLASQLARAQPRTLVQVWVPKTYAPASALQPSNAEYRHALEVLPPVAADRVVQAHVTNLKNLLIWLGSATIVTLDMGNDRSQDALREAVRSLAQLPAFAWVHAGSGDISGAGHHRCALVDTEIIKRLEPDLARVPIPPAAAPVV